MYQFFVYILSSETRTLYIGVTNDLVRRVHEHQQKVRAGFTQQYDVKKLVYYECFRYVNNAIRREKELKGWRRSKKLDLITAQNPLWKDLAAEWDAGDTATGTRDPSGLPSG